MPANGPHPTERIVAIPALRMQNYFKGIAKTAMKITKTGQTIKISWYGDGFLPRTDKT